jgi:HPt (histidine-containing phosphotransfer) domain-containing protein
MQPSAHARLADAPPDVAGPPDAFRIALEGMLRERGIDDLQVRPGTTERARAWSYGATLRLHLNDHRIRDFAVLGDASSIAALARCLFGFPADMLLTGAALLDALGETLNQIVGRLKQHVLDEEGVEATLETPQTLDAAGCAIYAASHADASAVLVASARWPGELLVLSGSPKAHALHCVDEAVAVLEGFGDDERGLGRVQRILDEIGDALAPFSRVPSLTTTLTWCARQVANLINGVPEARAAAVGERVQLELRRLRGCLAAVVAPAEASAFRLPDDPEMLELLREFSDEAHPILDAAESALDGGGQELAHTLFRSMHTIKGNAGFFGLEQVRGLAHATENLLATARDRGGELDALQVEAVRRSIVLVRRWVRQLDEIVGDQAGDIPFDTELAEHQHMLEHAHASGDALVLWTTQTPCDPATSTSGREMIRIAPELLDRLDDIDRDLHAVVTRAAGEQVAAADLLAELGGVRESLHTTCQSMRRVGLDRLFGKTARLCRETAEKLGKLVKVELVGEQLDVPRHVAAALSGPLVHLARNAVDHGVETPDARSASGKERLARVELRAARRNGAIVVEVVDDGRGIDTARVLDKAVRMGLVAAGVVLPTEEILALIMAPGFSTAEHTTDISGRGVGMDVVKREIENAGGRIELATTPGSGSRFTIVVPEIPGGDTPTPSGAQPAEPEPELEAAGELMFL